ncbi:hypothetical protein T440DRAFT_101260 [Plenodomus tracheiphilus IPT5]|uniref:Uncharacterized protein n=1 Tax=Plenodomus tracheiphilus IPT5 TaxID=1408161 RepID=A0A6A7BLE2_9PLEO|nr:hypothetical protein T440DRAFT_101260 [Plenodomus tracheiphilus IPT5]
MSKPFTLDLSSLPSTFQSTWRANPDPTALPFPRSKPPFALTPIDWHQLSLSDSDFTPHSWPNLQHLISNHQLEELKRWPSQLKAYLAWTAHVKEKYESVLRYLLEQRLFWTPLATQDGELRFEVQSETAFAHEEDYKILRNDWGYAFEPGVRHIVVWLKQRLPVDELGALSEEGRGERGEKVLWFKNTTTLQSVRSLEHVHVLVRGVEEDLLERWMK